MEVYCDIPFHDDADALQFVPFVVDGFGTVSVVDWGCNIKLVTRATNRCAVLNLA
jgi:hypothetical protein